ncbi:Segregation and condensation protein A [Chlamydiales bacterium STE3]|nr:Segregation and condensation protein A [Chlamydiales bacterium STE3]
MSVTLANFSGPLELLFHLVQKKEIDIYEIPIIKITEQFLRLLSSSKTDFPLETGAEFLNYSASLLWLKSKALLPTNEQVEEAEEKWEDPHFEIIHHLIDYCKFKQAAHLLSEREEKCFDSFNRGIQNEPAIARSLGIDHLSITDIATLFQEILNKTSANRQTIKGETWRVSDKMISINKLLALTPKLPFQTLFHKDCCKEELITLFLAVLELIKLGTLQVIREHNMVVICKYEGN